MNTKEKIAVMAAWLEGKEIQIKDAHAEESWSDSLTGSEPNWNWEENNYRIKPAKKLEIPWEIIKHRYKYAAMDKSGNVFVYSEQPEISSFKNFWNSCGDYTDSLSELNMDTDGVDWETSLTKRP